MSTRCMLSVGVLTEYVCAVFRALIFCCLHIPCNH